MLNLEDSKVVVVLCRVIGNINMTPAERAEDVVAQFPNVKKERHFEMIEDILTLHGEREKHENTKRIGSSYQVNAGMLFNMLFSSWGMDFQTSMDEALKTNSPKKIADTVFFYMKHAFDFKQRIIVLAYVFSHFEHLESCECKTEA
jgi:hypothetical protein